jgi:hypothetical protein
LDFTDIAIILLLDVIVEGEKAFKVLFESLNLTVAKEPNASL